MCEWILGYGFVQDLVGRLGGSGEHLFLCKGARHVVEGRWPVYCKIRLSVRLGSAKTHCCIVI